MNLGDLNWENFWQQAAKCDVTVGPNDLALCGQKADYSDNDGNGLCTHHFDMLYDADERGEQAK